MKWYRVLSTAEQAFNFQNSLRMMKGKSEIPDVSSENKNLLDENSSDKSCIQ